MTVGAGNGAVDVPEEPITTERLFLTVLTVDDAEEMVEVLDDDRLHEFTGGRPATTDELRERYRRFTTGPGDPAEAWRNWVVRTRDGGVPVGTVQATITAAPDGRCTASVAWVTGSGWQGRGFATEAARALVDWLHRHGVDGVRAHIHPDHHASATVARRAGLLPSDEHRDGETVWREPERGGPVWPI